MHDHTHAASSGRSHTNAPYAAESSVDDGIVCGLPGNDRFKKLAAAAGVPVFKLSEGRHSAASLQPGAAVDLEIWRKALGHVGQAMTSRSTHIKAAAHREAAKAAARLVEGAGS